MLKTNDALARADLIRPLSLDALKYFASGEIPLADSYGNPLSCKFIRLGDAMMIGTTIKFGKEDWRAPKRSIVHANLLEQLEIDQDAYLIAKGTADEEPFTTGGRYPGVFNDGGYAHIQANGLIPTELNLSGDSFDYGRANEAGRQRSLEVAQRLIGATVSVSLLE